MFLSIQFLSKHAIWQQLSKIICFLWQMFLSTIFMFILCVECKCKGRGGGCSKELFKFANYAPQWNIWQFWIGSPESDVLKKKTTLCSLFTYTQSTYTNIAKELFFICKESFEDPLISWTNSLSLDFYSCLFPLLCSTP